MSDEVVSAANALAQEQDEQPHFCSFCGKKDSELPVDSLLMNGLEASICSGCIETLRDIIGFIKHSLAIKERPQALDATKH